MTATVAPPEPPRIHRPPFFIDLNKVPSLMEQRAAAWSKRSER